MKSHLTDERLIELSVGGSPSGDAHVDGCPSCSARLRELTTLLGEVDAVAAAQADAEFPADRLARQQARIVHRIEQDGRPGRLIAFPASQPQAPLLVRTRPARRWVAAAAVAGLVVGLVTGQLLPVGQGTSSAPRMVANESEWGIALRAVSTTMSEDDFLVQVEDAGATGPAALRPLDALTPRAWEVTAQ